MAGRLAAIVLFTGSCLGLLIALWSAFGGTLPLQPRGYRLDATFPDGTQLAEQADVRISGVPVGRVVHVAAAGNRIRATLQLDDRYVPLRGQVRAMLRAKSLLGETYVELTPGNRGAAPVRDGSTLPPGNVTPSTELDEIFRALDTRTRSALRTWLQSQAASVSGRGRAINDAFGQLPAFAQDSEELLRALDTQQAELRGVVRDTGTVAAALSARDDQLAALLRNGERVTATSARRADDLRATFRALPRFNTEATRTLDALDAFAHRADPVVSDLRGGAHEFSATAQDLGPTVRELRDWLATLGPLSDAARRGLPAATQVVTQLGGVLGEYDPVARQLNPILEWVRAYRRELVGFIANVVATTEATTRPRFSKDPVHYARASTVLGPEALAGYDHRVGTNRSNPYPLPGTSLLTGIPVLEDRRCGATMPSLIPEPPDDPDPRLWERIQSLALNDDVPAAPPCTRQPPFAGPGAYPHVAADASPSSPTP
jgi:virulence factor Mce-like protein